MLPGFLFHILGAIYTYKLGKHLFNEETGLIALLIYVTSLHLMISAMDVRAEAYLLGQIVPACYYWLLYDRRSSWKSLLLASAFTAMAMMTKGLFVVITIFSGLVFSWIYTRQFKRIVSPKWLLAYLLCLVGILPELVSLYLQFDLHPEKVIFGQNHVSGIAWYFWGSQFGRFFNSGPIVHKSGNPFFFIHTFLWAFLPWCLIFIAATYRSIRDFKFATTSERAKSIYLWAAFWLTFIMFSATKFQLDHYTNILMPFAAILCANYLNKRFDLRRLAAIQIGLSYLLVLLTTALILYLFKFSWSSLSVLAPLLVLYLLHQRTKYAYLAQCLVFPALAICSTFIFALLVNQVVYRPYDVGYNLAQFINHNPEPKVYDLNIGWTPLEFHSQIPYQLVTESASLPTDNAYYVALKESDWQKNSYGLDLAQFKIATRFCGNTIDKIVPFYANSAKLATHLNCYVVLQHATTH
jgi:4-amino-4-deoxy-L-arabinose transferase-like glycosyltransferase